MRRIATMLAISYALSITSAYAENAVLVNEYVKAGVNETTGTFGSGNNTSPGLLFDSTGTSTFNTSYDYLTPGSPFDGFAVKVDGTNYNNNNAGNIATITGGWTSGTTTSSTSASWTGSWTHDSTTWSIRHNYSLPSSQPYIDITTSITAGSAASALYFGRFIDPDARAASGDSSSTDNVLGYGAIPTTNVAFSEALSSRYALGLYSTNTNVTAGIQNWTQEADGYNGTIYGEGVNFGQGDDTIGLSWYWTGVSAGDILTANYAYIFGPSAFTAASSAVDGGAGGGDSSILTGTLTDVGSATDAAESGGSATPTVVSSTTSTITSTSEAVSSSLPVLTAAIQHHEATDDGKVQTVTVQKTTSVTTPVEVTTTSFDRTVSTYSDGSTTTTDGAATSTTTIRNDVETSVFEGRPIYLRVDQYAILDKVNSGINRIIGSDPWRRGGLQDGAVKFYLNANAAKGKADYGYSSETLNYGLTTEFLVNPSWRVLTSINKFKSDVSGSDSSGDLNKLLFSVGSIYEDKDFIFVSDLFYSDNDYKVNRFGGIYEIPLTLFTFDNSSQTTGKDYGVSQKVYYKVNNNVLPYVGGGITKSTRDAVEETGWIITRRAVESVNDYNKYLDGGLRLSTSVDDFDMHIQLGYSTDKWLTSQAGVYYNLTKESSIGLVASTQSNDDYSNKMLGLQANVKF